MSAISDANTKVLLGFQLSLTDAIVASSTRPIRSKKVILTGSSNGQNIFFPAKTIQYLRYVLSWPFIRHLVPLGTEFRSLIQAGSRTTLRARVTQLSTRVAFKPPHKRDLTATVRISLPGWRNTPYVARIALHEHASATRCAAPPRLPSFGEGQCIAIHFDRVPDPQQVAGTDRATTSCW